jgi:hypothetical protein
MYMVVAAVAPVFITIFFCVLDCARIVPPDIRVYQLVIALSIAVSAAGLITTLRHWGWTWGPWALATMAYCVIMYGVLITVSSFILLFWMGTG